MGIWVRQNRLSGTNEHILRESRFVTKDLAKFCWHNLILCYYSTKSSTPSSEDASESLSESLVVLSSL